MDSKVQNGDEVTQAFRHKSIRNFSIEGFKFRDHLMILVGQKEIDKFLRIISGQPRYIKNQIVEVLNIENERPLSIGSVGVRGVMGSRQAGQIATQRPADMPSQAEIDKLRAEAAEAAELKTKLAAMQSQQAQQAGQAKTVESAKLETSAPEAKSADDKPKDEPTPEAKPNPLAGLKTQQASQQK